MLEQLADWIMKYASIPALVTSGYALFVFRKLNREFKIFSYFIFLSGIIELISKILWFQSMNNLPLLHIYVAVGFILQVWFYHSVLKGYINSRVIWSVAIIFTTFTIINSAFFQPLTTFNSNAVTIQAILVIILSMSSYILMLNDIVREERMDLIRGFNWINSGLFIYYTSSLLVFYFSDMVMTHFSALANKYLWSVHTLFLISMYTCFCIGLWKHLRK